MIEIRQKDRIFVSVLAPLVAIAALWFGWCRPAASRVAGLEARLGALPDPATWPVEKRALERRAAEAEAELAATKAEPPPESRMTGNPSASAAARRAEMLELLRECGIVVGGIEPVEGFKGRGAEALRATGLRPEPVAERFSFEAPYPVALKALELIDSRRMAAIPAAIGMEGGRTLKWEMTLWL